MSKATKRVVVIAAQEKSARVAQVGRTPKLKSQGTSAKPKRAATQATARLEARVPSELYEIMKHAAELRGVSLTSYIIDSVGEQARKDIEQVMIIRLALPDQIRLAKALLNPPAPNERLKKAFALRNALIASP